MLSCRNIALRIKVITTLYEYTKFLKNTFLKRFIIYRLVYTKTSVVPDADLAGYPANNLTGYLNRPDIRPDGYPARRISVTTLTKKTNYKRWFEQKLKYIQVPNFRLELSTHVVRYNADRRRKPYCLNAFPLVYNIIFMLLLTSR